MEQASEPGVVYAESNCFQATQWAVGVTFLKRDPRKEVVWRLRITCDQAKFVYQGEMKLISGLITLYKP